MTKDYDEKIKQAALSIEADQFSTGDVRVKIGKAYRLSTVELLMGQDYIDATLKNLTSLGILVGLPMSGINSMYRLATSDDIKPCGYCNVVAAPAIHAFEVKLKDMLDHAKQQLFQDSKNQRGMAGPDNEQLKHRNTSDLASSASRVIALEEAYFCLNEIIAA